MPLLQLYVFVLAAFLGYQIISRVPPLLHTPLMAATNAISGIIILGAIMQIGGGGWVVPLLSAIAVLIASINIVGGFLVTRRMLAMFTKS
jgi:H+-translocating NAD(P) transhydrogenase subunit alpha